MYILCIYDISFETFNSFSSVLTPPIFNAEALENVMCDVKKTCLKGRYATKSGNVNQPLNIKTAVDRSVLKLGLPI